MYRFAIQALTALATAAATQTPVAMNTSASALLRKISRWEATKCRLWTMEEIQWALWETWAEELSQTLAA